MSVAQLSARELGTFAGILVKFQNSTLAKAVEIAETISLGNCAAWAASDNDTIEPVPALDIERVALDELAAGDCGLMGHFGPLVYNMIDQSGNPHVSLFGESIEADEAIKAIDKLETLVNKWQDDRRRQFQRREQNAVAYSDVPRLPTMTREAIQAEMESLGYSRVIVAEFGVDESDMMSDYHGGRTARSVVIGYGTGKRESFKQLREAAAGFKPTESYGPGCDVWSVVAIKDPNETSHRPYYFMKDQDGGNAVFLTEDQARTAADDCIANHEQCQPGYVGGVDFPLMAKEFGYELRKESIENRENYSMGGGNYLGRSRYGGWQVSSSFGIYQAEMEVLNFPRKPAKVSKAAKKKAPAVEFVTFDVITHETKGTVSYGAIVKVAKTQVTVWYNGRSLSVSANRRNRTGNFFRSWELAIDYYATANVKTAIKAAQDRIESEMRSGQDQPQPPETVAKSTPVTETPVADIDESLAHLTWL